MKSFKSYITEVSLDKVREVHKARVAQYDKAKKTGDTEATEKAKSKMQSSFKKYFAKDKKETEKMYAKGPKTSDEIKKAANAEHEYNKSRGWSNEEVELEEDGMAVAGPTNVTGQQSGTDPVSATAVSRKRKPVLFRTKRNPPKM